MAIYVYPMLSSSAVSPAALPGIAKVLERYILIYEFDSIMRASKAHGKQSIELSTGMKLRLKEDRGLMFLEDYVEEQGKKGSDTSGWSRSKYEKEYEELKRKFDDLSRTYERTKKQFDDIDNKWRDIKRALDEAEKRKDKEEIRKLSKELNDTGKQRDYVSRELERAQKELDQLKGQKEKEERDREVAKDRRERSKVDIRTTDLGGSVTAEPTWVKVETRLGPSILGVKVISFPVRSDATLSELMMSDRQLGFMMAQCISVYRKTVRGLYGLWYKTVGRLPFLGRKPLSGDVRQDVIFNTSVHRDRVFTCLSYMDLDDEFTRRAGGIAKLYKLGWNSFVISDDVDKRAIFCMREFSGLCSTVPYAFIYNSLEQGKVYESLEDVRKASSPFFKLSTKSSKLFGECLAATKLEKYLLEYKAEPLTEDIGSLAKKFSPNILKKISSDLDNAVKSKSDKKIMEVLNKAKIPRLNFSRVENFAKRMIPDFNKSYELSKKVISNSLPNFPSKLVEPVSAIIAIKSSVKENMMSETRNNLKLFVTRFRTPDVQKQIKAEKVLAAIMTSVFGVGTITAFTAMALNVGLVPAFLTIGLFAITAAIIIGGPPGEDIV